MNSIYKVDEEYIYYCSDCENVFQFGIKDAERYDFDLMRLWTDGERKCNFCDKIGYCRQYHKDEYIDTFSELM